MYHLNTYKFDLSCERVRTKIAPTHRRACLLNFLYIYQLYFIR